MTTYNRPYAGRDTDRAIAALDVLLMGLFGLELHIVARAAIDVYGVAPDTEEGTEFAELVAAGMVVIDGENDAGEPTFALTDAGWFRVVRIALNMRDLDKP